MAKKVIMPKQGLQMTEGTIINWIYKEGENVTENQPLLEIETDKTTTEIDAPADGVLLKIIREEGDVVPVSEIIAIIGEAGEDISEFLDSGSDAVVQVADVEVEVNRSVERVAAGDKRKNYTPRALMTAQQRGIDINSVTPSVTGEIVVEKDVLNWEGEKSGAKITPVAKRIAEQNDVDLDGVSGTGAKGKITKADVLGTFNRSENCDEGRTRLIPLTSMRRIIAKRMVESLSVQAQTTHTITVNMENAAKLREQFKATGKSVSFNDIVLMAVSRGLTEHPMMNASFTDEGIVLHNYVNIGIAVALDGGLIVPNIKDAHKMRLLEIGENAKTLATKARENKLSSQDYSGGTFTVSNLGMYGLDKFVAIINPPESGILALGAIKKQCIVENDEPTIARMMEMTLTYDHRIIDGAPAAEFLCRVKECIENSSLML